ncbi:MAG: transposase [Bacteroidota bacterium]
MNWQQQLGKMQVGQCLNLTVYLGKEKKVKTRLIIERVPDEIAHQRRRKLNTKMRNKSKPLSKARLAFCSVNAFITNTTKAQLPAVELRSIYRLRWQIELYFKTWKSYMNIDKIERMNIHRFNCTHYGTLLYIILCCKVFLCFKQTTWKQHHKELSELKAIKFLAKHRDCLWEILYLPIQKARDRLETLQNILHTHGIKERKKGTLTPYQTIERVLS